MLFNDLKKRISGEVTYETKRSIVKQLVREVIVCTEHIEGKDRPDVNIHVRFVCSQVMMCTDKRSDNNLDKTTFEWSVNHATETLACNTPGERIRWARRQKGWLIKTLAAKAGITRWV
ncbi:MULTISPECIES: helix-turn-helix transcriptional regulator [Pelosinus]|jgi:ribosome-binding protein aMBF1 (putative translation factor)|uniref:Uncharacterized protein n=2 Tax=Pelosinus TaxID=365348 RepID=I9LDB0_9FIRM|nr:MULTISPECIES: helix-turn-helix transcriptional regulator [Pelosinus]EIW18306.1 hypothetical protein FB4_3480 [Pelosinus fermentans B4]EIW24292.1 hypothetical protein FA11_3481 [Pelosinus fermentans A11]OAM94262.1 hypothetical protein FR7_02280 [Pelosinus fermentans DSM 17108]SDR04498.1 hypothetical protein SAMN04515679_2384 [Pelosinus fermentans]